MLIGNKRQFYSTPWSYFGQVFTGAQNPRLNYRWRFTGESWAKNASVPLGTEGSYAYVLAIKGGGLASYTSIIGDWSLVGYAVNGVNLEWNLEWSGDLVGSANLIATLIANLAGSGSLTGNLVGTVQLASNMVGSGDLVGGLKLFAGLVADLNGSGDLSGNLKGTASMSADIYVNESELQVVNIVNGVWNAVASEYATPGSTGEALQSGWSGGGATPAEIWEYSTRTLTSGGGANTWNNIWAYAIGGKFDFPWFSDDKNKKDRIYELAEKIDSLPEIDLDPVMEKLKALETLNKKLTQMQEQMEAEKKEKDKKEQERIKSEKLEEQKNEEEIQAILKEIKKVEADHEKNILKAIQKAEKDHEKEIEKALKNL